MADILLYALWGSGWLSRNQVSQFMFQVIIIALFLSLFVSKTGFAQVNQAKLFNEEAEFPKVIDLNWLNEQFLIRQRQRIDKAARRSLGQPLKIGKYNLQVLQRLINEEVIPKEDTLALQAMGVTLGDIFVNSHKHLSWQVYEDELGKSHAVCVDKTLHCLFPVTMLSRRIELGVKPTVRRLYDKGLSDMKPYLPKLPFVD